MENNRWRHKVIDNFILLNKDIKEITVNQDDEWQFPDGPDDIASVTVWAGDNLTEDFIRRLELDEEEKGFLRNEGWTDFYVGIDVQNETIRNIEVVAFLGDHEKTMTIHFDMPAMGRELYFHLAHSEPGYAKFLEECKEEIKKDKMMTNNMEFEAKENFMDALDILKKAFENVASTGSSVYIDDEVFDGDNNYPFGYAFDDMPGIVETWVDSVMKRMQAEFIHGTYDVAIYMSSIIPKWRGDNNLAAMEIEGTVLFDWYAEKVAPVENPGEEVSPKVFNYWIENVQSADMIEGLYEYAKAKGGVISIVPFVEG